jgi:hypothetical protein
VVGPSWALQVLAQQLCRAHVVGGHRIFSFVNLAFLKAGAVAVAFGGCSARSSAQRELVSSVLYTTLAGSTFDLGSTARALRLEQDCDTSVRGDSPPSFAGDLWVASFGCSSNLTPGQ